MKGNVFILIGFLKHMAPKIKKLIIIASSFLIFSLMSLVAYAGSTVAILD